jgi:hypothetical protein
MSKNKRKIKYSWKKGWSGRGTEMMNIMESFTPTSHQIKKVDRPVYEIQLRMLLQEYPNNEFYRSLQDWVLMKRPLSEKQRQAIERGYNGLMRFRQRYLVHGARK